MARPPAHARLRVRLLSLVYEGLILAAVLFIATAAFTLAFGDSSHQPLHAVLQGYLFLVAGCYFVASWTGGRRTLPMRTWRIHLVGANGSPPDARHAAMRYFAAAAGLTLCGIGFLWAFVDRHGAFLHDRLAGTRLVADDPTSSSG